MPFGPAGPVAAPGPCLPRESELAEGDADAGLDAPVAPIDGQAEGVNYLLHRHGCLAAEIILEDLFPEVGRACQVLGLLRRREDLVIPDPPLFAPAVAGDGLGPELVPIGSRVADGIVWLGAD